MPGSSTSSFPERRLAALRLLFLLVLCLPVLVAAAQPVQKQASSDLGRRSSTAHTAPVSAPTPFKAGTSPVAHERPALAPAQPLLTERLRQQVAAAPAATVPAKLDAGARLWLKAATGAGKRSGALRSAGTAALASRTDATGALFVDLFVDLHRASDAPALDALGLVRRAQVGSVVVVRAPLEALPALSTHPAVRAVEASRHSKLAMQASRAEIRADQVHQGTGLPRAYQGEGVVVGVLDSGLDVTHPDFSDDRGSRIQYLLEYTADGGQREWTKAQIDADPAAVTQRDGDGGGGHGTHVTGTAAGGGRHDADLRGIAPKSDIIFVKGIRDPDGHGGFSDADVIAGTQYIFEKAAAMDKPAVVNLSLGGNNGPLDGTSAHERALSGLTGPGRIIVAAAGNEGYDVIHAGATSEAGTTNFTMLHPDESNFARMELWYEPGVVSEVAIGLFDDRNGALELVDMTEWVAAGTFSDAVGLETNGTTAGYAYIDGETTRDPNNGDGHFFLLVFPNDDPSIDVSEYAWGVFSRGASSGRVDLWIEGGAFERSVLGLSDVNEIPGDTKQTVGSPATAERVISVGSYVTTNTWTSVDGGRYNWNNPDPNDPESDVVPVLGQRSYFSSQGPTRDGRIAPDIAAPGELIFAAMSSHLSPDAVERPLVLSGDRYLGMQGTSMASPHIAGVVALMLQAYPALDYSEAIEILQETARTDVHTGATPNNLFGAGRVDAYAAVAMAAARGGDTGGGDTGGGDTGGGDTGGGDASVRMSHFDPTGPQRVWTAQDGGFVFGTNAYGDRAKAVAFDPPAGEAGTQTTVRAVNVWFGYKHADVADETYTLSLYAGDAASGPQGAPLFSQAYPLADVNADADPQTAEEPTVHTLDEPIAVDGPFFAAIDFGTYATTDLATLVAGERQDVRVAEVWEMAQNGAWSNLSDAWLGDGNAGSGSGGWHLWMEVEVSAQQTVRAEDRPEVPTALALHGSFPNPFRHAATIRYELPSATHVRLAVYDLLGREVAVLIDALQTSGRHDAVFESDGYASGMYFYRIEAGGHRQTGRMTLLD